MCETKNKTIAMGNKEVNSSININQMENIGTNDYRREIENQVRRLKNLKNCGKNAKKGK